MGLQDVSTLALALTGVLFGWFDCVEDAQQLNSRWNAIPVVGQYLARVNRFGWLALLVIFLLTGFNLHLSGEQQAAADAKLKEIAISQHVQLETSVESLAAIEKGFRESLATTDRLGEVLRKSGEELSVFSDSYESRTKSHLIFATLAASHDFTFSHLRSIVEMHKEQIGPA